MCHDCDLALAKPGLIDYTCSSQSTCLHHKGLKVGLYMYFSFSSGLEPSVPFMWRVFTRGSLSSSYLQQPDYGIPPADMTSRNFVTTTLQMYLVWPNRSRQLMRSALPLSACMPSEDPNSIAKVCSTSSATNQGQTVSTRTGPCYCDHRSCCIRPSEGL